MGSVCSIIRVLKSVPVFSAAGVARRTLGRLVLWRRCEIGRPSSHGDRSPGIMRIVRMLSDTAEAQGWCAAIRPGPLVTDDTRGELKNLKDPSTGHLRSVRNK